MAACGDSRPQRILRLGTLAAPPAAAAVEIPAARVLGAEPQIIPAGINAARITRLELRAAGDATLAALAWRLADDPHFPPYRALSFPLNSDGREHVYEIDLQREAYWTGQVDALRLAAVGGRLTVRGLTGRPAPDLYRSMARKGESLPAIPGLARIEVPLPADLPRGTVFETRLGLVPEVDRPGTRALFRVDRVEDGGRRRPWLVETFAGAGGEGGGWRQVRKELPAGTRGLSLVVSATRAGAPLPEGVALWGDPLLVTPGRRQGKNLVVVLIDTLRTDALGAYGGRDGLTPNLDAFARQGIRLAELTSPAPWTLPSVTSLATGLQPQTHGAGLRFGNFAPTGLTGAARTMAETLRDRGFYTLGVYHNIYVNPAFGLQKGFDEYASHEEGAGFLVDQALARLSRYARDRRFFLYLHLFDCHNPYEPPPEQCRSVARRLEPGYRGPLGCAGDRRPENPLPPVGDRRWLQALYKAEVAYTDAQMGRFLAGLTRLGLDDDTVVAIVSDHGEEFWTRMDQERALGYEVNGDHGHTHYQELLHVPGLIRAPGHAPAVIAPPVQMVDLFPTLLRLVGVAPPPSQGTDLTPLLAGAPPPARATLISDLLLHGAPRWSVRRGPWKLILPRDPGSGGLPVELYDLDHDPGETRNLAPGEPRTVADLRAWGEREAAERVRARSRFLGGESLGATYLEWNHITKLRALGYLR